MKAQIDVRDRSEKRAVEVAMGDQVMKATAIVLGALMQIPAGRRASVLGFVGDGLAAQEDEAERGADA